MRRKDEGNRDFERKEHTRYKGKKARNSEVRSVLQSLIGIVGHPHRGTFHAMEEPIIMSKARDSDVSSKL